MAKAGITGQLRLEGEQWKRALHQAEREAQGFSERVGRQMNAAASGGGGGAAGGRGGGRGGRIGQTLLQAGYMVDDLQYGLRGVINNVGALTAGMGPMGAAIGGAATIALVGWNLFGDSILRATGLMKDQEEAARRLSRQIEQEAESMKYVMAVANERRQALVALTEQERQLRMEADRDLRLQQERADLMAEMAKINANTQIESEADRVLEVSRIEQQRLRERAAAEVKLAILQRDTNRKNLEDLREQLKLEEEKLAAWKANPNFALTATGREAIARLESGVEGMRERERVLAAEDARLADQATAADKAANNIDLKAALIGAKAAQEAEAIRAREEEKQKADALRKSREALEEFTRGLDTARARQEMQEEIRIQEMKASGNVRGAERAQRALDFQRRARQMEAMGFEPEEARSLARREMVARESSSRVSEEARPTVRPDGRRKIIGAGHRSKQRPDFGRNPNDPFGFGGGFHTPSMLDALRQGMNMPQLGVFEQRNVPRRREQHDQRVEAALQRNANTGKASSSETTLRQILATEQRISDQITRLSNMLAQVKAASVTVASN